MLAGGWVGGWAGMSGKRKGNIKKYTVKECMGWLVLTTRLHAVYRRNLLAAGCEDWGHNRQALSSGSIQASGCPEGWRNVHSTCSLYDACALLRL